MKALLMAFSIILSASMAFAQDNHVNRGLFYIGPSTQSGQVSGVQDFYLSDFNYWGSAYGASSVAASSANGAFNQVGINLGATGEFGDGHEFNLGTNYYGEDLIAWDIGLSYNVASIVGAESFRLLLGGSYFITSYKKQVDTLRPANSTTILTSDGAFSNGQKVFVTGGASGWMGKVTARMDLTDSMMLSLDAGLPLGVQSAAKIQVDGTELTDGDSMLDAPTGNTIDPMAGSKITYSTLINLTVGWKY